MQSHCPFPASLSSQTFMRDDLLLGPFKLQNGETGEQIGLVRNIPELIALWQKIPLSSVAYHARQQHLSRWFFSRAEFGLAKRFRASDYPSDFIDEQGRERADWLRNWILSEVRAHRNKMTSFVESPEAADATTLMVRCGSGSLGGKGRGFRFLHNVADRFNLISCSPPPSLTVSEQAKGEGGVCGEGRGREVGGMGGVEGGCRDRTKGRREEGKGT